MIRAIAAVVTMAAAALFGAPSAGSHDSVEGQPNGSALTHEYADVNGVRLLTIKRIPDGTHWIAREKAGEVNDLIREFLAQPTEPGKPARP